MINQRPRLIVLGLGEFSDKVRPVILEYLCNKNPNQPIDNWLFTYAHQMESAILKHYVQEIFMAQVVNFSRMEVNDDLLGYVERAVPFVQVLFHRCFRDHHLGTSNLTDFVNVVYVGRDLFVSNFL